MDVFQCFSKWIILNGSPISAYDEKLISLNFGLRRSFNWRIIIVAVEKPIIGADFFLHFFELMVDIKNKSLIDENYLP